MSGVSLQDIWTRGLGKKYTRELIIFSSRDRKRIKGTYFYELSLETQDSTAYGYFMKEGKPLRIKTGFRHINGRKIIHYTTNQDGNIILAKKNFGLIYLPLKLTGLQIEDEKQILGIDSEPGLFPLIYVHEGKPYFLLEDKSNQIVSCECNTIPTQITNSRKNKDLTYRLYQPPIKQKRLTLTQRKIEKHFIKPKINSTLVDWKNQTEPDEEKGQYLN